ncbi:MAG: PepSY-associated TM helix domain-containing protein [Myxococcota bacterium]
MRGAISKLAPPRIRPVLVVLHRVVGLLIAAFLMVAGLTGSVIAFYDEFDAFVAPELHYVEPAGRTLLDPLVAIRNLERAHPRVQVSFVPLVVEEGRTIRVFAKEQGELFIDPYDGAIVGRRPSRDLSQGRIAIVPWLHRLHYSLHLGKNGTLLLGFAALLWVFDCFVGAALTFPASRKRLRPPEWLQRWRRVFGVDSSRWAALGFTGHRAVGLWMWGLLLVFALSGTILNLRATSNAVLDATLGLTERPPTLSSPPAAPALTREQAVERAGKQLAEAAMEGGFSAERLVGIRYTRGRWILYANSDRDVTWERGQTRAYVDDQTGELVAVQTPYDKPGDLVRATLLALHMGEVGGWPYRLLVSVLGLGVAWLSLSGVWIWWRRRSRRTSPRSTPGRTHRSQRRPGT